MSHAPLFDPTAPRVPRKSLYLRRRHSLLSWRPALAHGGRMRVGRAAASVARLSPRRSAQSGLAAIGGVSRSGTAARHMGPLKNRTTAARADDARRWWVLATVVAAQFIYGC